MAERYPIRPITADEFDAFHHVTEQAFHEGPPSERARAGMLSAGPSWTAPWPRSTGPRRSAAQASTASGCACRARWPRWAG